MQESRFEDPSARRTTRRVLTSVAIVLSIVFIVGGAISLTSRSHGHSPHTRVEADFRHIHFAALMFEEDFGRWPISLDELRSPPPLENGELQTYLRTHSIDPWSGEPYQRILHPDGTWSLLSYGGDQLPGGTGFDADVRGDVLLPRW